MTTAFEHLPRLEVRLSQRQVLRLQGYGSRPASPEVTALAAQAIEQARLLSRPQTIYAILDTAALAVKGGADRRRTALSGPASAGEKLALAICTIGPDVEAAVDRCFREGDLPLAAMLDSAGSVAVESVADQVNHAICRQAAAMQLRAGARRSPGYSGWPLEEQLSIFDLLPADSIGVRLTESMMMRPIKSISFGVALGWKLDPGHPNHCRRCGMVDCQFRRGKDDGP